MFTLIRNAALHITEESNHRVQIISFEGDTMTIFGNEGPEKLDKPTSCISHKDKFLVCDGGKNYIEVFISQEHSYTSLGDKEIKTDNLTSLSEFIWTVPKISWCVTVTIIEFSNFL